MERTTQPLTLSGIPRVEGVAPETPQEDVRNALSILRLAGSWEGELAEQPLLGSHVKLARADYDAIVARLTLAVTKLERR